MLARFLLLVSTLLMDEPVLPCFTQIADCAVIGKPDERAGEVPIAFVVLKPDVSEQLSWR